MFKFDRTAFATLRRERITALEATMRSHAQRQFPNVVHALGPSGTESLLRSALEGAARAGFTSQRDTARYVNLAFHYGPGFPESEDFAWAREILADRLPARLDRLVSTSLSDDGP